jgi:hypothetical protein
MFQGLAAVGQRVATMQSVAHWFTASILGKEAGYGSNFIVYMYMRDSKENE